MPRPDRLRGQRNRVRIAQVAARLVAEHGLTDWVAAKRKACRELGLTDDEALPNNEEVEQALRDYNTLFRSSTHASVLRAQRAVALDWMQQLSEWHPILIGGVAEGWATAHSDVCLELEAEDPKAVELALINSGVDYAAAAPRGNMADSVSLLIERDGVAIRLSIVSPQRRRHRSRRDGDTRLSTVELLALLALDDAPKDEQRGA